MNIEFNFPDVGEWQPSNKEALIPLETAIMAMISSVDNVAEGLNNNKFEGEDVTFALMYIVTTSCKVGCLMQQHHDQLAELEGESIVEQVKDLIK